MISERRYKNMVRYKKKGGKTKAPPKAEFDFLYYDCDMSAQQMAEKYNVNIHTVYNWAVKYRNEDRKNEKKN